MKFRTVFALSRLGREDEHDLHRIWETLLGPALSNPSKGSSSALLMP